MSVAQEPAGMYAVVRVWSAPAHHVAAPAEQVTYVKGPSGWGDGSTYWYVLGCDDGWPWGSGDARPAAGSMRQ